jgi:hypothetical protein
MKKQYRVRKEIRKFESGREEIWFIPEWKWFLFWRGYGLTSFYSTDYSTEPAEYKTEKEAWKCINTVKDKTLI